MYTRKTLGRFFWAGSADHYRAIKSWLGPGLVLFRPRHAGSEVRMTFDQVLRAGPAPNGRATFSGLGPSQYPGLTIFMYPRGQAAFWTGQQTSNSHTYIYIYIYGEAPITCSGWPGP